MYLQWHGSLHRRSLYRLDPKCLEVLTLTFCIAGYVLFSISNVKTLFAKVWPTCWSTYKVCNKTWTQATDYLQVCGIILGQITVGVEGDWVGRRWGLIQDAAIMLIATVLLTSVWGAGGALQGWVIG